MTDSRLLIFFTYILSVIFGYIVYRSRYCISWYLYKISNRTPITRNVKSLLVIFYIFVFLIFSIYCLGIIDLIKFSIIIFGSLLIGYSFYFFYLAKSDYFSISFFVIIAVCAFLIVISYYPTLIIGMNISDIKELSTAENYQSIIVNIVLGFSAVIGIGITLIWVDQGIKWRKAVSGMFAYLMFYFIYVMYIVFLSELIQRIVALNH